MNDDIDPEISKPRVIPWAIACGVLQVLFYFGLAIWHIRDGWWPAESYVEKHGPIPGDFFGMEARKPGSGSYDSFYTYNRITGLILAMIAFAGAIPPYLVARSIRRPWLYYTYMSYIALGLLCGCLPLSLVVLVFWARRNTRIWYCGA